MFDKSLDKELFSKEKIIGKTKLIISIFSYNNGPKKLQISRKNLNNNEEYVFSKLGRLTLEEIKAIKPLIEEAIKIMEE